MDKKQRKEFRSLLYQRYGSQYMEDKDSVETLYDAPFNWVMLEVKAGWHPTFILTEWKKRFNAMQRMIVEVCGNTLSLLKWDYYVSSLAACTHPETAKQVLLTGIGIDEAIEICQQKLSPDLLSALLQTISPGKIKAEDLLGFGIPQFGKSTSSRVIFEQQQGRAVRGEPVSVTLWKEEREKVLDLRKKAVAKNPQLEYELLRLNWLIGDNQPKGGRVVRLKILSLATYHTLAEILILRGKILDCINDNSSAIKTIALNNSDTRIWIDALQEWRNPYDVMQEIERVIKHCGEKTLDYADFHTNALKRIAYSLSVPAHLLMEDIPGVKRCKGGCGRGVRGSDYCKECEVKMFGGSVTYRTFTNTVFGEPYEPTPKMCAHCLCVSDSTATTCKHCGRKFGGGYVHGVEKRPGGYMVISGCNNPLRSVSTGYIIDDLDANPATGEILVMPENIGRMIDKIMISIDHDGPAIDWMKIFRNSKTVEQLNEELGFKFKVTDNFSQEFSKQTTNMNNQSTTNGQPMTKEEKRKRISEIENQLAQIKAHRKQVTDYRFRTLCQPSEARRTLAIKIGATTENGSSFYDQGVMLWPCEFMSTKTFMKLYKLELDETEAELTTELNKLIA